MTVETAGSKTLVARLLAAEQQNKARDIVGSALLKEAAARIEFLEHDLKCFREELREMRREARVR